jgi:hypothetical protein
VYNLTPLHYAVRFQLDDVIKLLLKAGANEFAKDISYLGRTPIEYADTIYRVKLISDNILTFTPALLSDDKFSTLFKIEDGRKIANEKVELKKATNKKPEEISEKISDLVTIITETGYPNNRKEFNDINEIKTTDKYEKMTRAEMAIIYKRFKERITLYSNIASSKLDLNNGNSLDDVQKSIDNFNKLQKLTTKCKIIVKVAQEKGYNLEVNNFGDNKKIGCF